MKTFVATISVEGGDHYHWEVQAKDVRDVEEMVNSEIQSENTLAQAGAVVEDIKEGLLYPRSTRPINTNIDDYYTDS